MEGARRLSRGLRLQTAGELGATQTAASDADGKNKGTERATRATRACSMRGLGACKTLSEALSIAIYSSWAPLAPTRPSTHRASHMADLRPRRRLEVAIGDDFTLREARSQEAEERHEKRRRERSRRKKSARSKSRRRTKTRSRSRRKGGTSAPIIINIHNKKTFVKCMPVARTPVKDSDKSRLKKVSFAMAFPVTPRVGVSV